jgi:hypothetical protein
MWTLGTVQLFPQNLDLDDDQVIARLQPLASGTIYHTFGYEYEINKLSAYIVGMADKITLTNYNRDASVHTLLEDAFSWGNYYVKHLAFKLEPGAYQTIRPDLPCDDYIFTVDFELWKNE